MSLIDRIRTERHVEAMVALDTMDLLVTRVKNLLSHGRRIAMAHRYTYCDSAPDLYAGLTVDASAYRDGFTSGGSADGRHFGVALSPGLHGFGFSAYAGDGNDTEAQAWRRYHAKVADSGDPFERRRDMTLIRLVGGLDNDGPARDDLIVIRAWNQHGVCDERVIAFDRGGDL